MTDPIETPALHCPLPWTTDMGIIWSSPIEGGCQMKPSVVRVADIRGWGHLSYRPDGEAMQAGNAALIVTAVNNHARLLAALRQIAALNDTGASAHLAITGSYTLFDEPGSVRIAREALGIKP